MCAKKQVKKDEFLKDDDIESDTLISKFKNRFFFFYRSICIIDNGASRRRARNARFRDRRADHSTTFIDLIFYPRCQMEQIKIKN